MAELTYLITASLDGFIADEDGSFDHTNPDDEVHEFVNDLVADTGTFLFGRRMYQVMTYWETASEHADSPVEADFARIWRAADKVVFSRTLNAPSTARTRLERSFDPDLVRSLKETSDRPLGIGGADLAGQAVAAGLVDELQLFVVPQLVGGGTPFLPGGTRARLTLVDEQRFGNGTVFLRYRVENAP